MKKLGKWIAIILLLAVVVVIAAVSYVSFALPNVGDPEKIQVQVTPERIERGKYLANNVAVCVDCHSKRDFSLFAGPIDSSRIGSGGEKFDKSIGFPGTVYVPNITPVNLKNWSDGEIFRAITCGVKKDGSAIFPIMPWSYYSKMDREDVYDIIAYLRTLKPAGEQQPARKLDFPLNLIVNTMPAKATLGKRPATTDTIKYGEYLVTTAACKDCHSQDDKGKLIAGLEFAGGKAFGMPGATIRSSNITPDVETGIGGWTREQFVNRFQQFASGHAEPVTKGGYQTIMPWWRYGAMKTADLEAIYAYLHTLKPVKNKVVKFEVNAIASN